jgi:membrane-associated protease RseP (regulator of RpoE activity)
MTAGRMLKMGIHRSILVVVLLLATALEAAAQGTDMQPTKPILPGLFLAPAPELIHAQFPQLEAGHGLVVEKIGPDVPAAFSILRRNDILLSLDGQPLKDAEQFHRLVFGIKVERKVPLAVLRAGKEMTFEISLRPGDPMQNTARGPIKRDGPPAVEIECTVRNDGKLQMVLNYYGISTSKLETLTCSGSLGEIEQQVREHNLPNRVEELVDVALKRLRAVNSK